MPLTARVYKVNKRGGYGFARLPDERPVFFHQNDRRPVQLHDGQPVIGRGKVEPCLPQLHSEIICSIERNPETRKYRAVEWALGADWNDKPF
ncbi:MAG: hypothetical protein U0517_02710 [Candidatus Andersenbacteria bacterium]